MSKCKECKTHPCTCDVELTEEEIEWLTPFLVDIDVDTDEDGDDAVSE